MARESKLLVADADATVREVIRLATAEQGWICDFAAEGIAALKLLRRGAYDLHVLEAELPEVDGRTVCRHLRRTAQTPVIFLSRRGAEEDRLAGFAAGGNDYVCKPFYPRELVARIRSFLALCGAAAEQPRIVEAGHLRIDISRREAYVDGRRVALSPKEFDLLLFLAGNPSIACSRAKLLDLVWGAEFEGTDRTVDTHIKSLRSKLRPYQDMLETVWGYGYRFVPS